MDKNLDELFAQMQDEIRQSDSLSEEMRAWSLNYLKNHRKRYHHDLELVGKYHQEGPVLELGSAPYQFTLLLAGLGYAVTGVDIDPSRFTAVIKDNRIKSVKCNVETEELPFEDDAFKLILFNEIFEHMRIDPIRTLEKIRRVLHPEGYLILSTPNLYSITTYVNFVLGKGFDDPYEQFEKISKYGHMGHVREYSVKQVHKFLTKTGFRVVETRLSSYHLLKGLWFPLNGVRKVIPGFHAFQTHVCKKA